MAIPFVAVGPGFAHDAHLRLACQPSQRSDLKSSPVKWVSKTGAPAFSRSKRQPSMSSVSMYGSPVARSFLGTCAPVYQTTSIVPSFSFAVLATGLHRRRRRIGAPDLLLHREPLSTSGKSR